jgi:hypothetical protein
MLRLLYAAKLDVPGVDLSVGDHVRLLVSGPVVERRSKDGTVPVRVTDWQYDIHCPSCGHPV